MPESNTDKPIPALYSGFAMMLAVLLYTKSFTYSVGCGLFAMLLFHGQNKPKAILKDKDKDF